MKKQIALGFILCCWSVSAIGQYTDRPQFDLTWLEKTWSHIQHGADVKNLYYAEKEDRNDLNEYFESLRNDLRAKGYTKENMDILTGGYSSLGLWEREFLLVLDPESDHAVYTAVPLRISMKALNYGDAERIKPSDEMPFNFSDEHWSLLQQVIKLVIEEAQDPPDSYWRTEVESDRADYSKFKSSYDWNAEGVSFYAYRHLDNEEKVDIELDLSEIAIDGLTKKQVASLAMICIQEELFRKGYVRTVAFENSFEHDAFMIKRTFAGEVIPNQVLKADFSNEHLMIRAEDVKTPLELFLPPGPLTDASGNEYNVLRIGRYEITEPNLRTTRFNNGDSILVVSNGDEFFAYCAMRVPAATYAEFDPANASYGLYYNAAVLYDPRGIALNGYKVPNYDDWYNFTLELNHPREVTLLKADSTWPESSYTTNTFGFNALAGGRVDRNDFEEFGSCAYWWEYSPELKKPEVEDGNWGFVFRSFKMVQGKTLTPGVFEPSFFTSYDFGQNIRLIKSLKEKP